MPAAPREGEPAQAASWYEPAASPTARDPQPGDRLARFEASKAVDFEKWHDGVGYDLDLLDAMDANERSVVEAQLVAGGVRDWREVEALARLGTPGAFAALRQAMAGGPAEVRLAVARIAPQLVAVSDRTTSLVRALASTRPFDGLAAAIDEAAGFHPPAVVDALWQGVSNQEGEVAVHFAALLAYVEGLTTSPFDWDLRPFFLEFHTEDPAARAAAVAELRRRIAARDGNG